MISDQQEREIKVIADLDSTYLKVNCNDLESKTRLSNIFKAIVGKDITQKMYSMSEAFERGSKKMARREARLEYSGFACHHFSLIFLHSSVYFQVPFPQRPDDSQPFK